MRELTFFSERGGSRGRRKIKKKEGGLWLCVVV